MNRSISSKLLLGILATLLVGGCQSQRSFHSPEEALVALDDAVQRQDKKELHQILGEQAEQLQSGDPEQDQEDAVVFARKLAMSGKIRRDGPDRATILVGEEEWPFAVPLVMTKSAWRFDTTAGIEELHNRRIGRNELRTIAACRTLIDAQAQFFNMDPDSVGVKHYAQRWISSEGKKDGLYWQSLQGLDPSPIGPAMALAAARRDEEGQRVPFNGYLFKLLTREAASTTRPARDYMENGQLTRDWAVIAYPAFYGDSGIMSFLCGSGGVVYQKDLGDETEKVVDQINAFDPTDWQIVDGDGEN